MSNKISISVGNHTHKGMVRTNNQDSFGSAKNSWGELFIVADGMGGHKGGEVASKIAVDHICDAFKDGKGEEDPIYLLESTIQEANQAVVDRATENSDYEGMGTTIVAVIIKNNLAYFAHVGDSRIYLYRYKKKFFVTKDHSVVQDLLDKGLINEEEVENHPQSNRILQAVGTGKISVTISTHELYQNDYLLLCSDGVTGEVSESEILASILKHKPMAASKDLVEKANQNGGSDNSTCIIIKVESGPKVPAPQKQSSSASLKDTEKSSKYILAVGFLLLGVLLTVIGEKVYERYIKKPTFMIKVKKSKIGLEPDFEKIKLPKDSVDVGDSTDLGSVSNVIEKTDSLLKEDTKLITNGRDSTELNATKNK
ncbi:Stp1/IreP family PP2C-type Ser/Thr phosphatase [Candidatus Marinimicrobia bacterium]|nr:Stp1/IreP family PP2C-type Ser/Thr phosphatase [Candidatus Neomarinimicrobiota bacterium]